jgi:hypothetical protein
MPTKVKINGVKGQSGGLKKKTKQNKRSSNYNKDNVSGNCSQEESLSNSFGPPHFTTTTVSLKSQHSKFPD